MPGAAGKTEAVHSHCGNGIVLHLEFHTGVDGSALVFRYGEDGAGDQLLQRGLGNIHTAALVHIGQLRIILGRLCGNSKGSVARPDGYLIIVVHHNSDGTFRQTADNIAEQLCRQDAVAGIMDLGVDVIGDGSFHIVAGQIQTVGGITQNALDSRQCALLGNGSAGNIQARDQHAFFTGKTHGKNSFL